jgi:hypothetical protein
MRQTRRGKLIREAISDHKVGKRASRDDSKTFLADKALRRRSGQVALGRIYRSPIGVLERDWVGQRMWLWRLLREPLFQFLLIGAALFGGYSCSPSAGPV